jgi:hypothetical protein
MYRPSSEPLSSGRFRDVIVAEHDTLRRLIAQTVEVANSSVAGELDELRAAARQLYVTLEEHMSFEDQMLPVALRDVIGWGPALEARIAEDHERQRQEVVGALEALEADTLSWAELAAVVRAFATNLLLDMEREEEGLLDAELDAMSTDSEGG